VDQMQPLCERCVTAMLDREQTAQPERKLES
jgi:hypothetical protein